LLLLFTFSGFAMAQTIEDFESIKMNVFSAGANGKISVIPNPYPTSVNPSSYVAKMVRGKDGDTYAGFYATLPTPVDFGTYKFVHVKVWKPRISPIKFKLERSDGNIEISSINEQTVTNEWEDMVFDFSATTASGQYTKIVFFPDFPSTVNLTDDIIIYYDDLIVNDNPNPVSNPQQTFNVDMTAAGLAAGEKVYISGDFGGIYGSWAAPGSIPDNECTDTDGDGIYSVTMNLPDKLVEFKFFKGAGWGGDEKPPSGNRKIVISGDMDLYYLYKADGIVSETHTQSVIMENFESMAMNLMRGGANDLSTLEIVPNPDVTLNNPSDYVCKFLRDKDGVVWGGFYGTLATPLDFTTNKYVHVKVWKPRISPVKFKIEGGGSNPALEVASMNAQTVVNGWEDMVFDFSDRTGIYAGIVFQPDAMDPVGLTEDLTIYYDDFVLNNDPNQRVPPEQVFNLDMNGSGMPSGSKVWISGALGGIYGTWKTPGEVPENELTDPDGDGIYSITMNLTPQALDFKFFWGNDWNHGDPISNRAYTLTGDVVLNFIWNVAGYTLVKPIEGISFGIYPNPTNGLVTVQSSDMKGLTVRNILGSTLKTLKFQAISSKQIDLSDLKSGIYFISVETSNGIHTSKLIKK